jgi:tetratricopeptide (TPR) repeat protein
MLAGKRAAGGEGVAVLLAGEAGMGKSRLAEEVLRRLESTGFLTMRGRCLPDAPAPYLPIFEALKGAGLPHLLALERPPRLEYLYLASPGGLEMASAGRAASPLDRDLFLSMLTAIESFVTDTLGSLGGGARRLNAIGYGEWRILIVPRSFGNLVAVIRGTESQALVEALEGALDTIEASHGVELGAWDGDRALAARFAGPLRDLVAPGRFEGQEETVDPQDRKFRVLEGLSRGLLAESAKRPIAICLDDLHLADTATLSAFQYLTRSNRHSPLLLLATYRSEELLGRAGAANALSSLRVTLLAEGLLEEIVVGPLDEAGLAQLAREQVGVSDLDRELVSALFRETRGQPFFALEVLRYLKEEGRLERIGNTVRVKGDLEGGALPRHLRDAVRQRIARLPRDERDLLECAAVDGEVFSPSRIAFALDLKKLHVLRRLRNLEEDFHFVRLHGEDASFDHAKVREVIYQGIHADLRREYHAALGECALRDMEAGARDLTETVAFHFSKARDARAKPYLLQAAQRAFAASSYLEAAAWYQQYLALSGDAFDEAVYAGYGNALLVAGKFDQAGRVFEVLVKRAVSSPNYLVYLRDLAEAVGHAHGFEKAVAMLDNAKPAGEGLPWARWAVQRARFAVRVGQVDRAEKDVNRALPILQAEGGSRFDRAEANSVLAFIGETIGDYDMCVEFGTKAIAEAGDEVPMVAMYYNNVGVGHLFRGRFESAATALSGGLAIAEAKADFFRVALISTNLGLLEIRRGDLGAAREHLARGLKWAERIEAPFITGVALDFLGLSATEEGRDDEAAEYYRRALPLTDGSADSGQMIWLRIHIAMLELERGDPEQAQAWASDAYDLASKSGDAPEQAVARALIAGALGVQGDTDAASKGFAEAGRGLAHSPAQFEHAEVLRLWGQFLVDCGRLDEAGEMLRNAGAVYGAIGARGRSKSIADTLRAIGAPGALGPTAPGR